MGVLSKAFDWFAHGSSERITLQGVPVEGSNFHKMIDTAEFKVACVTSALSTALVGFEQGLLAGAFVFVGGMVGGLDLLRYKPNRQDVQDLVVNKNPSDVEIERFEDISYKLASVLETLNPPVLKGLDVTNALLMTTTVAGLAIFVPKEAIEGIEEAVILGGLNYAASGGWSMAANTFAKSDRMKKLKGEDPNLERQWILQPAGSSSDRDEQYSFLERFLDSLGGPRPEAI